MAILVFQHESDVTLGRLGACLRDHAQTLDIRRLWLPEGPKNPHIPSDFDNIDAVISLGGSMNVGDPGHAWMKPELEFLKAAHARKLPIIGICLGSQLIAKALGGDIGPMENGAQEWGMGRIMQHPVANTDIMLAGIAWTTWQFHAHGQEVKALPPGATVLQYSSACKVQSYRAGLRTYGFQYHFECDLPAIERFLSGHPSELRCAGVDNCEAAIAHARQHYAEYARLSNRLCVKLAEYLLPVSRRIVA